jgi:glycerol-3-phosphate acyltransferase PlsY
VLGLAPWAFLVALITWAVLVRLTGYVSLGSVVAAVVMPAALYLVYPERRQLLWLFVALAALIVLLHRGNIRRLLAGTEHRFGRPA